MKQKMTILMMSALALAMSLLSCTNDNNVSNNDRAEVRFTAAIGNAAVVATPASRAAGTSWAKNDAIGIFMVDNGTTTIAEQAANRHFTTPAGDGSFAPATGQAIYYPMNDSPVDFVAYYPYAATATWDGTLSVSTAGTQTTASQATIDYLWATANNQGNGYKKSAAGTPVSLTFSHRLSKLTMNCKLDPSIGTPDPDMTVTIHGMNTATTFTPKTGAITAPTTPAVITPRKLDNVPADYLAIYDAIIVPDNYGANEVTVEFNIHGEIFTWHVETVTFEPGKDHVYEVLITRTGVKAEATITDWTTENKGQVEAN